MGDVAGTAAPPGADDGYVTDAEPPEGSTARDHWYETSERGLTLGKEAQAGPELGAAFADVLRVRSAQVLEAVISANSATVPEGTSRPLGTHVDGTAWRPRDLASEVVERLSAFLDEFQERAARRREEADSDEPLWALRRRLRPDPAHEGR